MSETPGCLRKLRAAAFVAVILGAVGSIGLWIHATRHPPLAIIVLFVIWVLSPFVLLGISHAVAKRWAPGTQTALYLVMLFVSLGSILIYADDAIAHRTAHPAAVYVVVPAVAWVVSAVAIGLGAWIAKKKQKG